MELTESEPETNDRTALTWKQILVVVPALVPAMIIGGQSLPGPPFVEVTASECVDQWNQNPPIDGDGVSDVTIDPVPGGDHPTIAWCYISWTDSEGDRFSAWAPKSGFSNREDLPHWDMRSNAEPADQAQTAAAIDVDGKLRLIKSSGD